ncbi:AMP-binding protein [Lipingzhangella sp. LS1_29]|uniref:AMP-binding protein n=1 Tax=Lipingzhangella rawalii TaxID=2055835 RepID=A0ABU2H7L5_9ACTN|nr:AMP-binding protein [Lipingzhangella rawalii]MDS1270834.1 AMP-binding protein [Lipingzhangella rawalii]
MSQVLQESLHRYTTGLDSAVSTVVWEAAARVPAFATRLAEAGIEPRAVVGVHDLDALPIVTKDDMIARQRSDPPFGGYLAHDVRPRRVFQSPGPMYEPQLPGTDPWRWSEALRSLGVRSTDTVLNCFGYHLSPAGAMFEEGATTVGATVVPAGTGNLDLQAGLVAELDITAYTGLPSYLKALCTRFTEAGHDPQCWGIRRALVTAEPLPDSLRAELSAWVGEVRMAYGTAEAGLLGYETAPGSGLCLPGGVLVQVCDLSSGRPVTDATVGQVVVTLLRADYPLVRFGTGDLSAWMEGPDGTPRLAGVLGRVGDAVKVRGMFLHPRQAHTALADVPGLAGFQFVVERANHRDALRCLVTAGDGVDTDALTEDVRARIRTALRFEATVELVSEIAANADPVCDRRDWS